MRRLLRVVAAGALAIDAYVHADLVMRYEPNTAGGLSQGDLFRIEAAVAALAALVLVCTGRRLAWVLSFVVAASGVAAVLVYASYDLGAIGPVPNMYEPLWYPKKTLTTVAEALAGVTSILGFVTAPTGARSPRMRPGRLRPVLRRVVRSSPTRPEPRVDPGRRAPATQSAAASRHRTRWR